LGYECDEAGAPDTLKAYLEFLLKHAEFRFDNGNAFVPAALIEASKGDPMNGIVCKAFGGCLGTEQEMDSLDMRSDLCRSADCPLWEWQAKVGEHLYDYDSATGRCTVTVDLFLRDENPGKIWELAFIRSIKATMAAEEKKGNPKAYFLVKKPVA